MNSYVLHLAALLLVACSAEQGNKPVVSGSSSFNFFADGASKTTGTPQGNYFTLVQSSDSLFKINWGNSNLTQTYGKDFDLFFAQRISLEWENKDYLILHYWSGSNSWAEIVLPLDANEQAREVQNGRYFDEQQNLLVSEGYSGDTIFWVDNLRTGHRQPIIEKEKLCDSLTKSWCADTVYINGKSVSYSYNRQVPQGGSNTLTRTVRLTIE